MTLLGDIVRAVGRDALRELRPRIGSSTLREALTLIVQENEGSATADLFIPHYFAVFYHDGSPGFSMPRGKKLVFFARQKDDPRLPGGKYPERRADVRRLTKSEFERGLKINRIRRSQGAGPFMYVLSSIGPSAAHPFFDDYAQGHAERAGPEILRQFDAHIQGLIDSDKDLQPEKKTARLRLPRP